MHAVYKRIAGLGLILLMIAQPGGWMLFFLISQVHIQQQMISELKKESTGLVKLVLTEDEFRELRINDREINYRGKMFDYKTLEFKNGKIELTGKFDHKEEKLIHKMKSFQKTHTNRNKPNTENISGIKLSDFLKPRQPLLCIAVDLSIFLIARWKTDVPRVIIEMLVPPPRNI